MVNNATKPYIARRPIHSTDLSRLIIAVYKVKKVTLIAYEYCSAEVMDINNP